MPRTDDEIQAAVSKLQARDQAQRQAILAYGINLAKERQMDLSFWAPNRADADLLREALERNGMTAVKVLAPVPAKSDDSRWLITAGMVASVDFMTTLDNVATFVLFADKYNCEYDGWGTAIVEAANPPQ